jgi:hypothetical protein
MTRSDTHSPLRPGPPTVHDGAMLYATSAVSNHTVQDRGRADRAIGAIIFTLFGSLWLEAWVWLSQRGQWWRYVAVAAVGAAMLGAALRLYRRYRVAQSGAVATDADKRRDRLFNLINAGQWVVIFIGATLLNHTGLVAWDVPFIILVIGAHFLPLARLFKRPTHYVTGAAMVLFALTYPFLTGGPQSPVGPLGAGLILWASALWALRAGFRPASPAAG